MNYFFSDDIYFLDAVKSIKSDTIDAAKTFYITNKEELAKELLKCTSFDYVVFSFSIPFSLNLFDVINTYLNKNPSINRRKIIIIVDTRLDSVFIKTPYCNFVSKHTSISNFIYLIEKCRFNLEKYPIVSFSARQSQIFGLLLYGCAPKEVSSFLNLSQKTVYAHFHNSVMKMGFHKKNKLMYYCYGLFFTNLNSRS